MEPITDENIHQLVRRYLENPSSFPVPISNWNVSNVTNMKDLFKDAGSFNKPLNNWNVSNVTNMSGMFQYAGSFNKPLNNWNVSNVTDMTSMFQDAVVFNKSLNNWNVSNVTDMTYMFQDASLFNQPLNNWDVSKVIYMTSMFQGASSFNQPLDHWNVSNVEIMANMFQDAVSFNQPLVVQPIEHLNSEYVSWDVSNVYSMRDMFKGASSFNQSLSDWYITEDNNTIDMFLNSPLQERPDLWPTVVSDDEDEDEDEDDIDIDFVEDHNDIDIEIDEAANETFVRDHIDDVYNNLQTVPLKKSKISVESNDEGYDLIMLEDVKVTDYLSQDPANIVFYFGKNVALLSNKTILRNFLNGHTVKYACINTGSMAEHNIIKDTPYLHLNGVGFVTGGLVPLSKIKALLTNNSVRAVQIPSVSTGYATTTVSVAMLGPHANAVGASHCQEGQGDHIYSLKKMKVPSATIGGTRKRRKIRTKRRTKRTNKNKSLNRIPKKTIKRNK
jgi:surface protein